MPVDLKTTPQKSLVPADDPGMAGTQIVSSTEGELVAHDEESSDAHPSVGADVSMLTDKTPPWLRASRRMAIITLLVGVAFWFYSIQPVWHADPWSHIAYGKLIVSEGLPATEPLLPLARGMTYWNSSWLFDVLLRNVDRTLGGAGLQGATGIFAGLIVAIFVSSLAYTTGRTLLACGMGMALLFLIGHDLSILRSQLAGIVCFLTAWILWQGAIRNAHAWWQLPLLFAVWANLDSSFMVGLIVPVAMMAGRMVDRWVKTGQWKSILRDQHLGKLLLVTQLCVLATLLNPYQGRMWWEVLTFSQNPNLSAMVDWSPLTLRSTEGQFFAATILILMGVVRSSPRRLGTGEMVLLVSLAALGCWNTRQLVWFYPVALWMLALHASAILSKNGWAQHASPRAGKWSVVMVGLVWICFGFSPLGMRVLHGKQPTASRLNVAFAPVELTQYLVKKPPEGQIFNPVEWGDYLLVHGPENLKIFANSQVQRLPREVWRDYLTIVDLGSGWSEILDRYSINTVVLDKQFREGVIRRMKEETAWKLVYEDGRGAVFTRKLPITR